MFMKAFLVALIAGICKIDNRVFGMTMIQRPLIVGTLVGFIYGNPVEGMIIGAQFELLSMGLVGIGAHSGMPEITLGSALCTGFVLGSGTGTEVALALALPLIEGLYQREVRARLDSVLTLLELTLRRLDRGAVAAFPGVLPKVYSAESPSTMP